MNYFKGFVSVIKVLLILFSSMIIIATTVYADCNGSVGLNYGNYEDGIDGPYTNNGNGTISDQGTGLMWQQTSDGELRTYPEACDRCESLELGGHSDWELPDIYQLHTIVDTQYYPAVNDSYFNISDEERYWSGSTDSSISISAFIVRFDTGFTFSAVKEVELSTRCVRIENPMPKGPLSLEIQADKAKGEAPLEVSFSAVATGGAYPYYPSPYSFSWDFGYYDVNSGKQDDEVTFRHPGKYTVTCSVTDKLGKIVKKTLNKISVTSGTIPSSDIDFISNESTVTSFHGDDGMDGSYVDNGDGTVLDKRTGLVWLQTASGSTYKWAEAVWICHNLVYAGYDDWELPSIYELQTIVHEPGSPTINTFYFKNTKAEAYWSGNRYIYGRAWYLNFSNGSSGNSDSTDYFGSSYCIRCVRLGSFPPPFSDDEGSLTVTISPQGAIDAGAQWRVDGGQWQNSGATQTELTVGNHTVDFKDITGWTKPGSTTVNIQDGQTTTLTKSYTISQDDHGDSCATATTVGVNSTTDGNIQTAGDHDYCKIVVVSGGELTVYATGSTDTYGYLKDAQCSTIASNDDAGPDRNFQIIQSISPGTYYVAVKNYYSDKTGNYTLVVAFTDQETVAFYVAPDSQCDGNNPCYSTIQEAIDSANDGATIKIAQGDFDEDLVLDSDKGLRFEGGWDFSFAIQSGYTSISSMKISGGAITTQYLVIR